MEDKYKNKYRTTPARLDGWDYGSNALYFITICTKDRIPHFGDIVETQHLVSPSKKDIIVTETQHLVSLQETEIGRIAYDYWLQIPAHFHFVELDEFVIMPDHIHGILFINKPNKSNWEFNQFGPQRQNLASIIRGYKASVKKYATLNQLDFAWQSGYYDRVIRSEKEYHNIQQYIYDNPQQWFNGYTNNENFLSQ